MINAELGHVKTLEEFHSEIRRQQEEAHGEYYCAMHDSITKYMKGCDSYLELGTHQGGTAAAALLTKPKVVQLVDIDMSRYRKFLGPIAYQYAQDHNIDLRVREVDSTSLASTEVVDMLMIDSYHNPGHMAKELNTHGGNVLKYIVAHDTSIINGRANDSLYRVLVEFTKRASGGWRVIEHETRNVGFTVLKKG